MKMAAASGARRGVAYGGGGKENRLKNSEKRKSAARRRIAAKRGGGGRRAAGGISCSRRIIRKRSIENTAYAAAAYHQSGGGLSAKEMALAAYQRLAKYHRRPSLNGENISIYGASAAGIAAWRRWRDAQKWRGIILKNVCVQAWRITGMLVSAARAAAADETAPAVPAAWRHRRCVGGGVNSIDAGDSELRQRIVSILWRSEGRDGGGVAFQRRRRRAQAWRIVRRLVMAASGGSRGSWRMLHLVRHL